MSTKREKLLVVLATLVLVLGLALGAVAPAAGRAFGASQVSPAVYLQGPSGLLAHPMGGSSSGT
jgi:hypothetical protein